MEVRLEQKRGAWRDSELIIKHGESEGCEARLNWLKTGFEAMSVRAKIT